jgi:hypothetical protein
VIIDRGSALEHLHDWLKPGDTVYTVLRHVSRSGMLREIGVILLLLRDMDHLRLVSWERCSEAGESPADRFSYVGHCSACGDVNARIEVSGRERACFTYALDHPCDACVALARLMTEVGWSDLFDVRGLS